MAQLVSFTELFSCDQTELYEKHKDSKKYVDTIKLSVLIDQDGQLLLIMGKICYGITKQTKARFFLYENNYGPYMILDLENSLHGNYELLVKENCDLLVGCLSQKCTVIGKEKDVKKQQYLTPKGDIKPQVKEDEIQIGLPSAQDDGTYVQISKSLGKGMYFVGKILSKGIQTVGGFVANNIEPSKEIKFSQNTRQNLKKINEYSGQIFDFASNAVKNLINYGKQIASDAANQSQGVKKLQEQKLVSDVKNGAKTGIKVFINLYDGMVEASDEVKKGAFKAGGQILKKKYGVEAEEALRNVAEGFDNVVKVYKLPKDSVKQLFRVQKQKNTN